MTLSKPVGTGAFITAKLLAISASFIIGLALAGLGAVPWVGRVMPGSLTSWGNHLLAGQAGGAEWLALGVTLALIVGLAFLTTRILRNKEI